MSEVGVLLYPGVDELDVMGVLSPLRKASQDPACPFSAVLVGHSAEVESSGGVRLLSDVASDGRDYDALVLPGGPGAVNGAADPWQPLVCRAVAARVPVYGVCTAGVGLARWGLLADHAEVACHADKKADVRAAGYHGDLVSGVTSRGGITIVAGPGLPAIRPVLVGLYVIEDLVGSHLAASVAARLEVDWATIATRRISASNHTSVARA